MTGADATTFWATVAQIAAVLMLALVIDVRRLSGRWSKKRFYLRRIRRWFSAIIYFLVLIMLVSVLSTALLHLLGFQRPADEAAIALLALVFSSVVVIFPVLDPLISALMDSVVPPLVRAAVRYMKGRQRLAEESLARAERYVPWVRLDARVEYANALILESKAIRMRADSATLISAGAVVSQAKAYLERAEALQVPWELRERLDEAIDATEGAVMSFDKFLRRELADAAEA